MRRALVLVAAVAGAAAIGLTSAGKALAYGNADNPVAQVAISLNCDSAVYCPDIIGGGEGGLWIWAEIDDPNHTGGLSGTTDFTFAGCGHLVGGGGPHSSGGGGGHGEGTWQRYDSILDVLAAFGSNPNFIPAAVALTPDGQHLDVTMPYYVLDLGSTEGPSFFAVPAEYGHYDVSGLQIANVDPSNDFAVTLLQAPGVSGQTQVAP